MYPRSLMNQLAPFAQSQDPSQRLEDIERKRRADRARTLADARNEVIEAAKAWNTPIQQRYECRLSKAVDALWELEK